MASRKAKEKEKPPRQQTASPERPREKEIIPGKLSEKEWLQLLEREEPVEIVADLVNEVFDVAFSIVYTQYLEAQSFPYTVQEAKTSLLQVIEWQFLSRDEGEGNITSDPSWNEDEEPVPATIDSWARGVVPQASLTSLHTDMETERPPPRPLSTQSPDVLTHHSTQNNRARVNTASTVNTSVDRPPTSALLTSSTRSSALSKRERKAVPTRPRPIARRPQARRPQARLEALSHPPPIIDGETDGKPITESGDHSESLSSPHSCTPASSILAGPSLPRPLPYGMKPVQLTWQKEVTYDEQGNILDMVKLDPTKFPSHRVRPRVTMLQPSGGATVTRSSRPLKTKAKSQKATLLLSSQNRHLQPIMHTELDSSFCDGEHCEGIRGGVSLRSRRGDIGAELVAMESRRFPDMPTLPSLVDTIDPRPGITVHEGGRTTEGPKTFKTKGPSSPRANLRRVYPIDELPIHILSSTPKHNNIMCVPTELQS